MPVESATINDGPNEIVDAWRSSLLGADDSEIPVLKARKPWGTMRARSEDGESRSDSDEITALLVRWREGDEKALDELLPQVYEELREVAAAAFQRERSDHTLQPTAVLHEAFLRIAGPGASYENRAHFFGAAARAIRRVLVDYARRRSAAKRPNADDRITLVDAPTPKGRTDVEVLALHGALERLEQVDPRKAKIVELQTFGGLTQQEVSDFLGISRMTVSRERRLANMLLGRWLDTPAG